MSVAKRKCKNCGEYTETFIKVPAGIFCSVESAYKFARIKQEREQARLIAKLKQLGIKKDKAAKKAVREFKRNDRRYQFRLTKSVIQKWVNHIRDVGLPCISCGNTNSKIQYCGGHYKTAGGHPELALDTRNISRQCNQYCNLRLSGNISGNKTTKGYIVGLIERYGQEYVDYLDSYHEPKNYTCDQLIEIRAFYAKLIRDNNPDDSDRPFN